MHGQYLMKQFRVRGVRGVETYVRMLGENSEGYVILITSTSDTGVRETEETISRHLFDACVRTGYLAETQELIAAHTA